MYHVYCESTGTETVTLALDHARHVFFRYVREFPDNVVTCDKIEGLGRTDTAADIMLGDFTGRRVRLFHCDPES
jgi:hypothetical protein